MPKLSSINLSAKMPLYEAMEASTRGVRLARNRTAAQIKAVCDWLEEGMPMETRSRLRKMLMREVEIAYDSLDPSDPTPDAPGFVADGHPITPPEEMCARLLGDGKTFYEMLTEAARWGANQELDKCCEWLRDNGLYETRIGHLRSARRPKPLSQAEEALAVVDKISKCGYPGNMQDDHDYDVIRAALKRLQELEEK